MNAPVKLWQTGLVLLGQVDLIERGADTALAEFARRYRSGVPALEVLLEACGEVRQAPPPPNAKQRIAFVVQLAALAGEALRRFAGRWVLDEESAFGVVYELGFERVPLFDHATEFVADPNTAALDRIVQDLVAARRMST